MKLIDITEMISESLSSDRDTQPGHRGLTRIQVNCPEEETHAEQTTH